MRRVGVGWRSAGVLVGAWIIVACSCCQSAWAALSDFGVSGFSVQTTLVRKTTVEFQGVQEPEFVYEPYSFTQAGGHPYALTTTVEIKRADNESDANNVKDIAVDIPPGMLGNPMAVPRCPLRDFTQKGRCPAASQIGTAEITSNATIFVEPIYNLVAETGQSAEFGIPTGGQLNFVLTGHLVHTSQGYGLTVVSNNIPEQGFTKFRTNLWGVPADPSHDPERGRRCEAARAAEGEPPSCDDNGITYPGGESAGVAPVPFLILPSDCTAGPGAFHVFVDAWQEAGRFIEGPVSTIPPATGCGALSFSPTLSVSPDTRLADTPVGLGVNVSVPQPEEPGVPATPELRNAVVTAPAGLSISPGVVDGVQACNDLGPEGLNVSGPESERPGPDGEPELAPGHCPESSIVGTAEAITPLLPEPVRGHLYLARPLCGGAGQEPCTEADALDGRLYRLYLELGGRGALANTGINIKLAGVVSVDLATGRLTTSFLENPPLPFSELRLHLNGGPRASLANPQDCGEARTTADFTPWSAPGSTSAGVFVEGTPDANPFSFYTVMGCSAAPILTPGFSAGTVTQDAGVFTPFTMTLSRKDGEDDLAIVQVKTPPGLLGMLSSVPLCEEPDAARGTCPQSSRIGTTVVASGAGSHPFEIPGSVYLTTGYRGAPFGLSIVTNAVAGPFNLGLVVVRARIDVDPNTSTLTVTSDPLPQILFGVPLRLQRVSVSIDRPNFIFNPTNCHAQEMTATIAGAQGAAANVGDSFRVGGCSRLAFKPSLRAFTNGHTSRAGGASIDARLAIPSLPQGAQANIARVKVSLPKQLPSRLATLQKACPAATFERDPAGCPRASVVGIVRASTPVLPAVLTGPVYFVSHGGEAFPSLIIVLQGDGVRVDVTGTTFIGKAGVTSSTFRTIPDVPVRSFELYLPQGRDSALAANGNLCNAARSRGGKGVRHAGSHVQLSSPTLAMPTEFVGQNGTVIHSVTKIDVTGCGSRGKRAAAHKRGRRG